MNLKKKSLHLFLFLWEGAYCCCYYCCCLLNCFMSVPVCTSNSYKILVWISLLNSNNNNNISFSDSWNERSPCYGVKNCRGKSSCIIYFVPRWFYLFLMKRNEILVLLCMKWNFSVKYLGIINYCRINKFNILSLRWIFPERAVILNTIEFSPILFILDYGYWNSWIS